MPVQITTISTEYGNVTNPVCEISGLDATNIHDTNVQVNIACYLSLADLTAAKRPCFEDSFVDTKTNAAANHTTLDVWLKAQTTSKKNVDYSGGTIV